MKGLLEIQSRVTSVDTSFGIGPGWRSKRACLFMTQAVKRLYAYFFVGLSLVALTASKSAAEPASATNRTVRLAAAQPRSRLVNWHLKKPEEVLAQVDQSLAELERLVAQAAAQHCDAIAFPEDTLGLGTWLAGNPTLSRDILAVAVNRMLTRFGAAAAKHSIYLICCNDNAESSGNIYNTAFLLSRDGKEIGRYRKVCPTIHEGFRARGDRFPVFATPDLGGVGMLICYDMVFPETARALALGGADVIFHPTLGGAAIGDDDISRAAFRTRAVENFVYLVVAQRGSGSMIVSPQGKIIAEASEPDSLAIADIDPLGGREGGDAMNHQRDMRARLFRERNPAAFGILSDTNPPVLAKVPATITQQEAVEISHKVLTIGEDEFKAASVLAAQGKTQEAIAEFERLRKEYRDSWIDRRSAERLATLRGTAAKKSVTR
jgi:predicted amidohydrolase